MSPESFLFESQPERDEHWQRFFKVKRDVRFDGQPPSDDVAHALADDPRYMRFARLVAPQDWQAASQSKVTVGPGGTRDVSGIKFVVARLLQQGPDARLVRSIPVADRAAFVEKWRQNILRIYDSIPVEGDGYDDGSSPGQPPALERLPYLHSHVKPTGPIVHEPAEKQATVWSADRDIGRHNLGRRSQTPVGRHERYIRAKAARLNFTEQQADNITAKHPDGCPWKS